MLGPSYRIALLLLLSAGALQAQEILNHAIQDFRAGNFEAARRQLVELTGTNPQDAPAHSLLGLVLMQERSFENAEQEFRTVIQLQPGSAAAYVNLGNALVEEHRDSDAREEFLHALHIRPEDPIALSAVGLIEARADHNAEAELFLGKAHRLRPGDLQTTVALGAAYIEERKFSEAQAILKKLPENGGPSSQTVYSLAELALEHGSPELGAKLVASSPELRSRYAELSYQEAASLVRSNQQDDSEAHNERALRILLASGEPASDAAGYHDLLGTLYYEIDKPTEAVEELQKAVRLEPSDADHYYKLGMMFLKHRTAEGAIIVFTSALKEQPQSAKLLMGIGLSYYIQGNKAAAKEELKQAIASDPDYGPAYIVLCDLLSQSNEDDELMTVLSRANAVEPGNYLLPYYYGKVLLKHKDDEADVQLRASIARNPQFALAYLELGKVMANRKDNLAAIDALTTCLKLDPQIAEAHYFLFRLYHGMGDSKEAAAQLKQFQEIRQEYGDDERVRQLIFTVVN
jgi:Flp pilus assembly protein TadD